MRKSPAAAGDGSRVLVATGDRERASGGNLNE